MSRRTRTQNVWEGELNAQLNPGVLSVDLVTTTGITAPMYVTLAPENPTVEILKIISIVGNTVTFDQRNLEGSSGDQTHPVGTKVRATFTKQMLDDVFDDVEELEADDVAHAGAADPHPNYILSVNHGSSGDPHTQYLQESDFTKAAIDAFNINAGTLDGIDSTGFAYSNHTHPTSSHDHSTVYAPLSHVGSGGGAHADVTTSTDGFMTAADKTKLNGIATGATVNQTISAGTGLTGGGSGSSITLSHLDTSSQASVTNQTGAVVFNGITLDGFGHLTALSTRSLTAANIGAAATSHTHTNYVDRAAGSLSGSILYLASGGATGGAATLSNNVGVSRFMHNGTVIAEGNGTNYLEMFGIPYSAGNFELRCVEDGAGRTVSYFAIASARRFKEKIKYTKRAKDAVGWRWLLDTRQRDYVYKSDPDNEPHRFYVAEEIEEVLVKAGMDPEPYLTRDPEGALVNVDLKSMISDIVEGLKDLDARVAALEG